jgi:hypothetical protein
MNPLQECAPFVRRYTRRRTRRRVTQRAGAKRVGGERPPLGAPANAVNVEIGKKEILRSWAAFSKVRCGQQQRYGTPHGLEPAQCDNRWDIHKRLGSDVYDGCASGQGRFLRGEERLHRPAIVWQKTSQPIEKARQLLTAWGRRDAQALRHACAGDRPGDALPCVVILIVGD